MRSPRLFFILMLVLFVASPLAAMADQATLTVREANRLVIDMTIPQLQLATVTADGLQWDVANLPGYGETTLIGAPRVPIWTRLIEVGPTEGVQVNVSVSTSETLHDVNLLPAQSPMYRHETEPPVFTIDDFTYATDALYPTTMSATDEPVIIHGRRYIPVHVYPVRYNPATMQLAVATRLEIEILGGLTDQRNALRRTLPTSPAFAPIARAFSYRFARREENDNWIPQDGALLIIVADQFAMGIQPYIDWKTQKGLTVETVLTSSLTGGGQDATAIKQFLFDRYHDITAPPLDYVLLVGDFEHITTLFGIGNCSADSRFVTLDGNDYFPDTIIARYSIKNEQELANVVNKMVNYEAAPFMVDTEWFHKGLTVSGSDSVDDQNASFCGNILEENGYSQVDYFFQSSWSNTVANVTGALNEGRGWFTYFGHGSYSSWASINPGFNNQNVLNLANDGKLPVITDIACDNGHFDGSMGDCFAEVWMKHSETTGAANIFAASRNTPFGYTDQLGRGVAVGHFNWGMQTFGAASYFGKMYMYNFYPEPAGSTCEEVFQHYLIFGDPEQNIWSDTPREMEVTGADDLEVGALNFELNISVLATPLANALVHVWRDGVFDKAARTDDAGAVTFAFGEPLDAGVIELFVTGRNALPYEGQITVVAPGDDDDDNDTGGDDDDDDDTGGDDDDDDDDDDSVIGDDDDDDDDGCGS